MANQGGNEGGCVCVGGTIQCCNDILIHFSIPGMFTFDEELNEQEEAVDFPAFPQYSDDDEASTDGKRSHTHTHIILSSQAIPSLVCRWLTSRGDHSSAGGLLSPCGYALICQDKTFPARFFRTVGKYSCQVDCGSSCNGGLLIGLAIQVISHRYSSPMIQVTASNIHFKCC